MLCDSVAFCRRDSISRALLFFIMLVAADMADNCVRNDDVHDDVNWLAWVRPAVARNPVLATKTTFRKSSKRVRLAIPFASTVEW